MFGGAQFLNFSIMVLLAVLLRHPAMMRPSNDADGDLSLAGTLQDDAPALPTPLSKVELTYAYEENNRMSSRTFFYLLVVR